MLTRREFNTRPVSPVIRRAVVLPDTQSVYPTFLHMLYELAASMFSTHDTVAPTPPIPTPPPPPEMTAPTTSATKHATDRGLHIYAELKDHIIPEFERYVGEMWRLISEARRIDTIGTPHQALDAHIALQNQFHETARHLARLHDAVQRYALEAESALRSFKMDEDHRRTTKAKKPDLATATFLEDMANELSFLAKVTKNAAVWATRENKAADARVDQQLRHLIRVVQPYPLTGTHLRPYSRPDLYPPYPAS